MSKLPNESEDLYVERLAEEWMTDVRARAALVRVIKVARAEAVYTMTHENAKLRSEVESLEKRRDDLLQAMVNLTRDTPYPGEADDHKQRNAVLIAEVGTLRAKLKAHEERASSFCSQHQNGEKLDCLLCYPVTSAHYNGVVMQAAALRKALAGIWRVVQVDTPEMEKKTADLMIAMSYVPEALGTDAGRRVADLQQAYHDFFVEACVLLDSAEPVVNVAGITTARKRINDLLG